MVRKGLSPPAKMAIIKSVRGFTPKYGKNCFFADNAVIVGDVTMGENCTVWFNAVVRGDVHSITIGNDTNIQDGCVLHGDHGIACVLKKGS